MAERDCDFADASAEALPDLDLPLPLPDMLLDVVGGGGGERWVRGVLRARAKLAEMGQQGG